MVSRGIETNLIGHLGKISLKKTKKGVEFVIRRPWNPMTEMIRSELFGTLTGTPLEGLVALGFVLYPFVSLPLLLYLVHRCVFDKSAAGLTFRRKHDEARMKAARETQSAAVEAKPLSFPEKQPAAVIAERLLAILERGERAQRLEAATLLADMGAEEALGAMTRLDREMGAEMYAGQQLPNRPTPLFPLEDHKEEHEEEHEALEEICEAPEERAARSLILSDIVTSELREAALEFIVARSKLQPDGTPYTRRNSVRGPSKPSKTRANCL